MLQHTGCYLWPLLVYHCSLIIFHSSRHESLGGGERSSENKELVLLGCTLVQVGAGRSKGEMKTGIG